MMSLLHKIVFDDYLSEFINPRPRVFRKHSNYFDDFDDEEFIVRFRLSKDACLYVLSLIEEKLESFTNRNRPLSPINQLLLTLRFFATGSHLLSSGDFIGVSLSTAHRVVHKVSYELAMLRTKIILFPETIEEIEKAKLDNHLLARFPQCIGMIDCTHIRLQSPGPFYINEKSYYSLKVQAICNSNLEFMDIVSKWPGGTENDTIFNDCVRKTKFEAGCYKQCVLLGDNGYELSKFIMTPIKNPQTPGELLYNESHMHTRYCIDRMFWEWKKRFPILALGMRIKLDNVFPIITATAVLHNILKRFGEDVPPDDSTLRMPMTWDELLDLGDVSSPANTSDSEAGCAVRSIIVTNYFSKM